MGYNILFHPAAERRVHQSLSMVRRTLRRLGERFSRSVEKQIKVISKNPEHYQLKKRNCRESKVDVFPYIIVYKIYQKTNDILVVAVFHTSRKPVKKSRK